MKRKVIKQGNDTLTMTLPRNWTNEYKILPGDEINLEFRGNTLILSTDKLMSYEKQTKDISKLYSILPLVLLSFYRKGYDEVELIFEKEQTSIIIQNIIKDGSAGYHIIDHGKNSCLVKALSDVKGMDFNQVLRKLFILVKMKLEKITEAITKKEIDGLQSIIAMDSVPSRITNFCYRLLSKRSLKELDKINYFQLMVSNLENLNNQLNLLINVLLNISIDFSSKQLFDAMNEFKQIYCDFYSCYYDVNLHKLVSIINRKNILSEKLKLLDELNKDENRLFLNLNNSFIYFNEMVNTALIMTL